MHNNKESRLCLGNGWVGNRYECASKYTFATVSFSSVNNTECPIIDTFGRSLIVSDSLQQCVVPTVDALRE